jgi:hypothetical protein
VPQINKFPSLEAEEFEMLLRHDADHLALLRIQLELELELVFQVRPA